MLGRISSCEILENEAQEDERHPQKSKLTHVFKRRYSEMEKKNLEVRIYEGTL